MSNTDAFHDYKNLNPDTILSAVESIGFESDGRVLALNSYENRVYQVGLEADTPIIAKFYRPGRWSDESIQEEHDFSAELNAMEIPAVSPLQNADGQTLFSYGSFRFSLYPRVGGRAPELDDPEHLLQIGRCLARIHNIGAVQTFQHRPTIDIDSYCVQARSFLLQHDFIPADLLAAYSSLTEQLIDRLKQCFEQAGESVQLSLHGDCHIGNILWHNDTCLIVDFDDARSGPAVQDLWMLLSGERAYMTARLHDLLEGYCEFRDFDVRELALIEPLRGLRMMHYSAWLARRWDDPAFPLAFPWFNTQRYWEDHILTLREQMAKLDEPALQWNRP